MQAQGYAQLRRIKPGFQPLLLPAPDGASPVVVAASRGDGTLALPPTDQRRSLGAVHVCEHTECRLPAERFWESNNGGGSKGGRQLRRTQSSPGP